MRITQLIGTATPGRMYGSFAGKAQQAAGALTLEFSFTPRLSLTAHVTPRLAAAMTLAPRLRGGADVLPG